MTQYNTLNVILPNSQLKKLKSGVKNKKSRRFVKFCKDL